MATIQKHKGLDLVNLNKLFTEMKRNEDYDDISKDDKQNDRRHFLPIIQGKKSFTIGTINHSCNFIEGFQELLDKIERLQSQKEEFINTKKKNIFLNEKLTEITLKLRYDWARIETVDPGAAVILPDNKFFNV